jgi:hypothetical protein
MGTMGFGQTARQLLDNIFVKDSVDMEELRRQLTVIVYKVELKQNDQWHEFYASSDLEDAHQQFKQRRKQPLGKIARLTENFHNIVDDIWICRRVLRIQGEDEDDT